jgi:hypothetical protein
MEKVFREYFEDLFERNLPRQVTRIGLLHSPSYLFIFRIQPTKNRVALLPF